MRIILFILLVLGIAAQPAFATDAYSEKTGKPCAECHLDKSGGGPLTPSGAAFFANGHIWPEKTASPVPAKTAPRPLKLLLGFVHLLAGFMWIGTILYVHLVLKPKYAVGGLPKTELRLAWISIALIGATGVPLTMMRYPSHADLFATRSGQMLLLKISIYLFLVLSAAYVTLVLNSRLKKHRAGWQENDGRDGRPAWVKVGDLLYDFTESKRWANGGHFGRHQAGMDLTDALKGAPHGPEKLKNFPSFSLAGKALSSESRAVSTLYVMAYVNLFAALGVILVIAVWRWG